MRKVSCLLALAVCAAIAVSAVHSAFPPDQAVHVDGGGTGLFVDPSVTPTDMGLTTNFSVALKVNADGSASGHFTCVIPGTVTVDGHYDSGSYDPATGIATASGTATEVFPSLETITVAFTTTFKAGDPEVGEFTFSDDSGYFPVYPDDFDTELVIAGTITIK